MDLPLLAGGGDGLGDPSGRRLAGNGATTGHRAPHRGRPGGIVTSPFIHANAAHLAANLPPFAGLGYLVLHRAPSHFIAVAATIALATGGLVWLCARKATHVGMSGVIFGFLGYLIAAAWFTKTTPDLIVGGGVLLFYGGMLAGVAPVRGSTSWESHFLGLVAGIGRAWLDLG
ncbi:MAG: rhomboid family intramembrane serine protease [Opitutaceae bacterium]|nr:rhomboid family intramembrane serine protease [Opitutaceae bacterium]